MKQFAATAAALLATTAVATAGGLERDTGSMAILFAEGTYVELSFTHVDPDVSGVSTTNLQSGDMLSSYNYSNLSFRTDLTENLSFAFIWSQPIGASVAYPNLSNGYLFAGTTASVSSEQVAAVLRYEFENGFSVYGGLREVEASGTAAIPALGYSMDVEGSRELGYLIGAAYEMPEIAMRVALTYQSATDHTFSGTENGSTTLDFPVTVPQSLTLEAQSGIAEGTLLFGSVRWVDWSEFQLRPAGFAGATGGQALASNSQDVITYRLGVARRLSDSFVGLASVTYEPNGTGSSGGNSFMGNLDPRDGRLGIGIGGRWEAGNGWTITGGVQYIMFGDAVTARVTAPTTPFANFDDNTGYAASIRVGYSF